ncbi:MAG: EAL domain-containing protein [Lachnospiraceae bacterium]|nr:EAL domain-containing protein [Lachnospiraceae bacterium]
MSNLKEKRIKKLKKKRIWPSMVGLCLILFALVIVVVAILEMYFADLIDKKLYDSYKLSNKVTEYMFSHDVHSVSEEELNGFIEISDIIDSVVVCDSNNEIIWSNCDITPDINAVGKYYGVYEDELGLIIQEDENNLFKISKGYMYVAEGFINILFDKNTFLGITENYDKRDVPLISAKIWNVISYEDYTVLVLSDIYITTNDLIIVYLILVMMLLLTIVFAIYYVCSIIGIARSQKRITKLLYTDMVTGGYNWLYFTRKGSKLLKRNRGRFNYAMIKLRMEKYNSFCTCFGVREGEELIEKFYLALKKNIKKKEFMAHNEQADFGLLLIYDTIEELERRIIDIEKSLNNILPNIKMYFSAGVCIIDNNDRDVNSLYNNAAIARDMLGEDADNKIAFFDIEMNKQQLWERKVENEMEKALVKKEFKLYLQPKYSTKEESLAGAEALVRWIHPEEGFIPPNKFIPIFEKNGFILQLDDYMLEQVAMQQAKWIEEGKDVFPISVNVSRAHFTREDLAEHICKIVDKYNVPHNVIELELTESAFFDDKPVLIRTVKALRDYGFIVSMDDFGAGYSSLNSLKELSIDVLKIDADFFRGADSVDRGMLIVSEVIDLAKKLDMKIVAEGIESREQVDFLTQQECDLIQGYYFAKPMPVEEFEEKYN